MIKRNKQNQLITIMGPIIAVIGGLIWSLAITSAHSQETLAPKLKVELTLNEWNTVMEVINQSTAPHNRVVGVQQALVSQLQLQLEESNPQENPSDGDK